ncbi:uncharacterized protein LOC125577899 [Brassica napus]|uniref:uncharacterized protein LOC125577899 n=1 Tax=Brassica napus TaxID=3708 RepID=UPI0020786436|nr:uncharacterized protein LOC125577899 [Brassica napus]
MVSTLSKSLYLTYSDACISQSALATDSASATLTLSLRLRRFASAAASPTTPLCVYSCARGSRSPPVLHYPMRLQISFPFPQLGLDGSYTRGFYNTFIQNISPTWSSSHISSFRNCH